MSTRISSAGLLLMLAGCGADPAPPPADPPSGEPISCGPVGETLLPVCTVERAGEGLLILHHPDGGFRRLRVEAGTYAAADGAEVAVVAKPANATEVTIGGMRYRLPAKGATAGQ